MSDTKVLCPKGSKVCPACKQFVKGPRTKVCGCGHTFVKSVAASLRAAAKPVKVEIVEPQLPAVEIVLDPWTFSEIASREYVRGVTTIGKACPIILVPNRTKKIAKYVSEIGDVPTCNFSNIVEVAQNTPIRGEHDQ